MRIFVFYAHSSIFYVEMKIKFKIIKIWSTFSKVVGVGKAHKYFPLMQANDSRTARCLRPRNCYIEKFYGRCPNPQAFKKA